MQAKKTENTILIANIKAKTKLKLLNTKGSTLSCICPEER